MIGSEQAYYSGILEFIGVFIIALIREYGWLIVPVILAIIGRKLYKNHISETMAPLERLEDVKIKSGVYTPNEAEEERIVSLIKSKDPQFDKELFELFVQEIYIRFVKAYTNNDLDSMQKYVDINIIENFKLQIYQKNALELKDYVELLEFNYVDFFGYHTEGENEIVSVATNIDMYEYTKDNEGTIVIGSDKIKKSMTFILSFTRKVGGKTINNLKDYKDGKVHCPNCGGVITSSYSECEHCGTTLFNSTENWLLSHIDVL